MPRGKNQGVRFNVCQKKSNVFDRAALTFPSGGPVKCLYNVYVLYMYIYPCVCTYAYLIAVIRGMIIWRFYFTVSILLEYVFLKSRNMVLQVCSTIFIVYIYVCVCIYIYIFFSMIAYPSSVM